MSDTTPPAGEPGGPGGPDGSDGTDASGGSGARRGFATNLGFILAAVGSAVGLGNLWKFPYITGEFGGGAFVLVYLGCIALVGLPLMYAELILGKRGGKDVLGAARSLLRERGAAGHAIAWVIGLFGIAAGFLILSFYSVVAGWAIHFFFVGLGVIELSPDGAGVTFEALVGSSGLKLLWHTVFMALVIAVVARGVHAGIEKACKILMPALFAILVALLVYVGVTGGLGESLTFLFAPDFSKLSGEAVLQALGHAFFTLSLGMGAMVTYGSYLKRERHVVRDGLWVALLDTVIALVAGAVIFAVVFSFGKDPEAGPGLLFITLPDLFVQLPGGAIIAAAFFLLVVFAAWSSGISLLEVVVAFACDELGWKRRSSTLAVGGAIWVLGIASVFSGPFLDFLDGLTTKYVLPVGGLLIAIAVGWLVPRVDAEAGFRDVRGGAALAKAWTFVIRFVTPILVLLVILSGLGLLSFGE